jgi:multidrug efflux pump subunit AcrB
MNPGAWSVRNRVAANLLSIVLLVSGLAAAIVFIPRSVFPEVSTNFITVTVIDPGNALPEDIEQLVTRPIEEGVSNVRGLRNLISNSQPNGAFLFLEIESSIENLDPVLNEVRQEVAKVRRELPPTAEEPVIEEFEVPLPLLTLGVSYDASVAETDIRPVLRRMQRELRLVRGVADVQVDGFDEREIWIEVDPDRAERLGLGLADVLRAVDNANRDWSGGRLRGPGGERVVRILGEATDAAGFLDIPVLTHGGQSVLLRDIATVTDRSEEDRTRARLNLRPGVTFNVVKQKGADAREVADAALAVFRDIATTLPAGAERKVLVNTTQAIDIRIDTVLQNGYQALLIITILLVLFLHWRLAILVALGLPVALAGTFLVLLGLGSTFDVLSLFGMIMALGMLVDDAIVVSENIYRHYERGVGAVEAAIRGTGEVVGPVIGSVATTIAAFLPLLLGEGIIGKFLFVVPVVVISALTFSLVQAFFVLPHGRLRAPSAARPRPRSPPCPTPALARTPAPDPLGALLGNPCRRGRCAGMGRRALPPRAHAGAPPALPRGRRILLHGGRRARIRGRRRHPLPPVLRGLLGPRVRETRPAVQHVP